MNPVPGAFGGAPYQATKRSAGRDERDMRWAGRRYEPCPWNLRWSSLWGYETLCWACREGHAVGGEPHMNPVSGAFGGAPYAARKRYTGRAERDMR